MVGLPLDDDEEDVDDHAEIVVTDKGTMANIMLGGSVATKAAEAELQRRIESLRKQLQAAEESLQSLRSDEVEESNDSKKTTMAATNSDQNHTTTPTKLQRRLRTTRTGSDDSYLLQGPPAKRGYLFKWLDRSIGWSGTKWALRFVVLQGGRISYFRSHTETTNSPRYVLSLRGCAVQDDGWKRNKRHPSWNRKIKGKPVVEPPGLDTPGAYFFLFSIYQRSENDDRGDVIPLLRFSTPNEAERAQWVQLIADSCAYCETDTFLADETAQAAEIDRQQKQQLSMRLAMPEAKEGTLPPLFFAPASTTSTGPARRPSLSPKQGSLLGGKHFRRRSRNFGDVDQKEAQPRGYPASKPMHRSSSPSFLSADAPVQNYRGLFNLGMIVLVVSNFRLILGTVRTHGFVMTKFLQHLQDLKSMQRDPWENFPFISGCLLQLLFILTTLGIEWLLSRKKLPETLGMILHHINAHSLLLIVMIIVWNFIQKPAVGAVLLFHGTITWMKLISYYLANEDYRRSMKHGDFESHHAMMALIEHVDADDGNIVYPNNVTIGNMFYFYLAPTLTYQIAFPKYPRVRPVRVFSLLLRMVAALALFTFLAAQVVTPSLEGLANDLEANHGTYTIGILAEYWLRLAIANTYLWLLMFYVYFHLFLNLTAELLRFGDRVFYKDWWNSAEVSAYWRLWNMPVHYWLIRHVYFPCIRSKMSKTMATFVVFLLSAIMHEVLVSIPFHMVRPWSFIGMMMQLPLVAITKSLYRMYPGSSIGNILFWLSFCFVGQPMAVMLYTVDFQYIQNRRSLEVSSNPSILKENECRMNWGANCLVR